MPQVNGMFDFHVYFFHVDKGWKISFTKHISFLCVFGKIFLKNNQFEGLIRTTLKQRSNYVC